MFKWLKRLFVRGSGSLAAQEKLMAELRRGAEVAHQAMINSGYIEQDEDGQFVPTERLLALRPQEGNVTNMDVRFMDGVPYAVLTTADGAVDTMRKRLN